MTMPKFLATMLRAVIGVRRAEAGEQSPPFADRSDQSATGAEPNCGANPGVVAKPNRNAIPGGAVVCDSRGGAMDHGIDLLAGYKAGRVEIADRKEFDRWTIRPSKEVVKKIEQLDQLTLAAEQRLGTFIVG